MGFNSFPWSNVGPVKIAGSHSIDFRGSRGCFVALVEHTDTNRAGVATDISNLVKDPTIVVTSLDQWVPYGPPRYRQAPSTALIADRELSLIATDEVDLTRPNPFLRQSEWSALGAWWFDFQHINAKGPTWDLISTFGAESPHARPKGLLLFEGKAHFDELKAESCGDHQRRVLEATAAQYPAVFSSTTWAERFPYQMANRFAFGLKLAEMGYDVVLVYLGFLNAAPGNHYKPFTSKADWETAVRQHGSSTGAKIADLVHPHVWSNPPIVLASGGSFRARLTSA